VGFVLSAFIAMAILVNVLFMQSGSHPAPMFKGAPVQMRAGGVTGSTSAAVPRPRPIESAALPAATKFAPPSTPRAPGERINDIQRELARRGYYDGVIDGLYGPKTDAAIRDFEQAAALKPSTEPNEAPLQAILRAPAKQAKASTAAPSGARPMPPSSDNAVERPAGSERTIALPLT